MDINLPNDSMQARLDRAGVITLRDPDGDYRKVHLSYKGKTIIRGHVIDCVSKCKTAFGLDI